MKSAKIQLEVSLIYLRRKHADMQRQLERIGRDSAARASVESVRLSADLHAIATDIAAREAKIADLDADIAQAEAGARAESLEELMRANDDLAAELAEIREDTLARLRTLVSSLRRYQELTDRKTRLSKRVGELSGRDLSYANYLDCALLRQSEYDSDLQYVLDYLKRTRIVA